MESYQSNARKSTAFSFKDIHPYLHRARLLYIDMCNVISVHECNNTDLTSDDPAQVEQANVAKPNMYN